MCVDDDTYPWDDERYDWGIPLDEDWDREDNWPLDTPPADYDDPYEDIDSTKER